jgi:hypothetical protein
MAPIRGGLKKAKNGMHQKTKTGGQADPQAALRISLGFRGPEGSGEFNSTNLPSGTSVSPSTILEQEAQTLGFREWLLPSAGIGSPQQTQTQNFISDTTDIK